MELNTIAVTLLLFGSMFLLIATGLPVMFVLGSIAILVTIFLWGPQALYNVATITFSVTMTYVLQAIPLFILMAAILQRSGVADALYNTIYKWMGGLRGGLAAGTVAIGTLIAAMSGVAAAATISLGVVALPAMLERKYDKLIVTGCIQAGGALGQLIPPSNEMIVLSLFAQLSVGRMFMGGVFPGLLLASLFVAYILILCYFRPSTGPALPKEERAHWGEKFASLKGVLLPLLMVFIVLGSIYFGIATPTEAASFGVFGALFSSVVYRRFTWSMLKGSAISALKISSMVMWIIFGGAVFSSIYIAVGAVDTVKEVMLLLPGGKWGILIAIMLTFFVLGTVLDPLGIIMITVPLYLPIVSELGFDPTWFGILFVMNMEMAFLTPPFGMTLFYMKAIVPKEITMLDIYRSVIPFVALQAVGLIIVIIFPQIALWLPNTMMGR